MALTWYRSIKSGWVKLVFWLQISSLSEMYPIKMVQISSLSEMYSIKMVQIKLYILNSKSIEGFKITLFLSNFPFFFTHHTLHEQNRD